MRTTMALIPALVLSAAGCGGASSTDGGPRTSPDGRSRELASSPREAAPGAAPPTTPCGAPPPLVRPATAYTGTTEAAREAVDAASRRLTGTGGRFRIVLEAAVVDLPPASAAISGRRLPGTASEARLVWSGAAGVLLPDGELRVVGDQLLMRSIATGRWRALGSASGASIDVGRELLDHPFLLEPVAAWRSGRSTVLALQAPADALRRYATTERRGPVSELLAGATALRIVVHVRDGELVGDRFTLATRIPWSLHRGLAGRTATIRGTSSYCRLRPRDRATIEVPPTAR